MRHPREPGWPRTRRRETRRETRSRVSTLGSLTEVTRVTELGTRRIDILAGNGLAIESKVGYTALSTTVQQQIARDALLLQAGRVNAVEWWFSRSAVTGLIGPSGPLQDALTKAQIQWTVIG